MHKVKQTSEILNNLSEEMKVFKERLGSVKTTDYMSSSVKDLKQIRHELEIMIVPTFTKLGIVVYKPLRVTHKQIISLFGSLSQG